MLETTHRGAKLAALVAAGVVVLGGVAAASGSLPNPVQTAAHDTLGAAGIDVPDGDGAGSLAADDPVTTTTTTSDPTTTTTSASDGSSTDGTEATDATDATDLRGPDPNGPAKFGLCTAYAAGQGSTHGHKTDSTAFRALAAAAAGEDESVTEFCADATPGGKATASTTTTPTTVAAPTTEAGTEAVTGSAPASRPPHAASPNHGAAAGSRGNPHKP